MLDSFEFTKIAGAVLTALLLIFGTKVLIEERMPGPPAKPGYSLPTATADAGAAGTTAEGGAEAAATGPAAVMAALPKASAEDGKSVFAKCKSCHTVDKGKPNGAGPNLWGVVDRARASSAGFNYSAAMKEKSGNWTFDDLAHFISNPKSFVPGTKMVFNGLPNATDAANLIAYLASQSDTPAALPK